jgi:hypothetical protein
MKVCGEDSGRVSWVRGGSDSRQHDRDGHRHVHDHRNREDLNVSLVYAL